MDEYNQSQILIDSVGHVLERGVYGDLASTKNTEAYSFIRLCGHKKKKRCLSGKAESH